MFCYVEAWRDRMSATMETERRNILIMTAFTDKLKARPDFVKAASTHKGKINIICASADFKMARQLENVLNVKPEKNCEAKKIMDFIRPGEAALNVGFDNSEKSGVTILILPDYDVENYDDEIRQFIGFVRGADEPREPEMNYLVLSTNSERNRLIKSYITDDRFDLDKNEDFEEAVEKLIRLLS